MGDGQRERCLVNGREIEREQELKSQEVSIRVSRLAEEPGEFWSSAAASLKPSVRVIILSAVSGRHRMMRVEAARELVLVAVVMVVVVVLVVVLLRRDSRLQYSAQRASRGQTDSGRQQQQWRQQQLADAGSAGFVP